MPRPCVGATESSIHIFRIFLIKVKDSVVYVGTSKKKLLGVWHWWILIQHKIQHDLSFLVIHNFLAYAEILCR